MALSESGSPSEFYAVTACGLILGSIGTYTFRTNRPRRSVQPASPSTGGASASIDAPRLKRVFELELERGCENGTVIGGIDRLLVELAESRSLSGTSSFGRLVRALPDGGYRELDRGRRESWIRNAVAALAETIGREALAKRRPAQGKKLSGPITVSASPTVLPGIGRAAAERLVKLGIFTAGDAVRHFPRRYSDFSDVRPIGELVPPLPAITVVGRVVRARQLRYGRRVRGSEAVIEDDTGSLKIVWFNMPYIARMLETGATIVVSGRVRHYRGKVQMENPDFEPMDDDLAHTGRIVPVYPATAGVSQRVLRRAIKAAVDELADRIPDPLPIWASRGVTQAEAIRTLHYPEALECAKPARREIALREFLAVQSAVLLRRADWQRDRVAPRLTLGRAREGLLESFGFELTKDQERSLAEILRDLEGPTPMLRLLQGDVGSGKTVVAFAALIAAVASGFQGALMAPTEILAEQHYRLFTQLLGGDSDSALQGVFTPDWLPRPIRMILLTGALSAGQREQVRSDVANGGADLVIGTHALLEEGVTLPRLGMAVVDEQHRFGVMQRLRLRHKGTNPHLLVMTATPIPRTLALTVYGDLDSSVIVELPPGRLPVNTVWVQPSEREEAYAILRERLDAGEQAFVICPLVAESEALDVKSAEEEYESLRRGPLKGYDVELLHGRMPGKQKDEIMTRFAAAESQVLVSTSVIEVGIDVPNATAIVIEGAERFGLSQLHQFRGRVGRSDKSAYCMLFSSAEDPGPDATRRLEAMIETNSGFKLSEVDLELRGEGEAWGTNQSGFQTMLKVAKITDRDILLEARALAEKVLERDPLLQLPEHQNLAAATKPFLEKATEAN